FFNRCVAAGYTLDSTKKYLINKLIIRLKTEKGIDGIKSQWNSADVINLIAANSQTVGFLNLKTGNFGNITMNIAGVFTADKGLKGNGTTTRGDSGFNPFDGLYTYNFKANDNSFGCYINTNTREIKGLISNLDASQNGFELRTHLSVITSINGNA